MKKISIVDIIIVNNISIKLILINIVLVMGMPIVYSNQLIESFSIT